MDASAYFRGKKVTLMGLGLLGRGVGDARYLASCGADLIVTDLKDEQALSSSLKELKSFTNIRYTLGRHKFEDFKGRDLVIKAAGVPLDSPYLKEARSEGTSVRMSSDLFAGLSGLPITGITGTRGKSTVTHMIAHIYQRAGKKVVLGGNVRGVSTLALLPSIEGGEVAVLELDSWQCQGFGEAGISPAVAVFTNLMPDHMNYYHNDMDTYLFDKAQIFLHQKKGDTLITGKAIAEKLHRVFGERIPNAPVVPEALPEDWALLVRGAHNRENAALARGAALSLGISDEIIRDALSSFKGVSGRLQLLRKVRGVEIYNDTTATTPEATLAALQALDEGGDKHIILIAGGADKGLSMDALIAEVKKRTKRVLLLSGSGTERILAELPDASVYDSLSLAFADAMRTALPGDIVILSPAFASFGMFKNEYERGDQFDTLVQAYA